MECENGDMRDFKGIRSDLVKTKAEMVENASSTSPAFRVVDARGNVRFRGETVEPRAGVRSGHIPGSRNLFFGDLLDDAKRFKSVAEMESAFARAGIDILNTRGPIVATCGTGVTACILALAMHECGVKDVGVYDGSWTEYGGADDETCPIKTGAPTVM